MSMEQKELSNMRLKQVAMTNVILLITLIIFFIIINVFSITFAYFFLVLGVLLFFQAIFGFFKGDSTKSIITFFEKVAIYEKQKLGSEWYKQRKVGYIWNLILSGLMFLQFYWNHNSTDNIFQIEPLFMSIIVFLLLVIVNINLIIHFRKVDRSNFESDLKGYTWKSNLIGVAVGMVLAFIIIVVTFSLVISGI